MQRFVRSSDTRELRTKHGWRGQQSGGLQWRCPTPRTKHDDDVANIEHQCRKQPFNQLKLLDLNRGVVGRED
jgi:hypothetical protein